MSDDFARRTRMGRPVSQIGLLGGDGRALEACCGLRREWSGVKPLRTVYGDSAIAVRPAVALDFRALPFMDGSFDEVFFDPPHIIRKSWWKHMNNRYDQFGNWETREDWEAALDAANVEFHRVTRSGAMLHVKIIHGKDRRVTKLDDLKRLTLWEQVDLRLRPSRVSWSSCDVVNATYKRVDRIAADSKEGL